MEAPRSLTRLLRVECDNPDLARYRAVMGTASIGMLKPVPGARLVDHESYWTVLTGLPEPDWNMALVHREAPTALAAVLAEITEMGVPALLLLAGEGRALSEQLPQHWRAAGEVPIMAVDPLEAPREADPRVRPATVNDVDVVTSLVSEAFAFRPHSARPCVSAVLANPSPAHRYWLLEDAGTPVSTVATSRVEDAMILSAMATAPAFARRGYGRALLTTVINWAAQDGARVGLLGATPAGEPLYAATGWKRVDSWSIYLNGTSAQFP